MPDFSAAAIQAPVRGSAYLRSGEHPWQATEHPGYWLKPLYEDAGKGERTLLMRADPGATSGAHAHEEFEQFFVLEGSIRDDHGVLQAGDFVCRAPGDMHAADSDSGALVLLVYSRHAPGR